MSRESKAQSQLLWISFAMFVAWVIAFCLQNWAGAYRAELSGYPDEPGHFISSLMVRQYLLDGWWKQGPMQFAEQYYVHYPRVAIGHWPPFLYLVQGVWMLVFPPTIAAVLWLQALIQASVVGLLFWRLRQDCGWLVVSVLSLVYLVLPESQRLSSQVMAEPLLGLLTLIALLGIERFLLNRRWRWLGVFVFATTCAIFTKGSGLALLPVLFFVVVVRQDWNLLKSWKFWAAHAIIIAAYAPWHIYTWKMVQNGMDTAPLTEVIWMQTVGFLSIPSLLLGLPLVGLALVAGWAGLKDTGAGILGLIGTITALVVFVFHCASPSGVETRRLYMMVPVLLLLIAWWTVAVPLRSWVVVGAAMVSLGMTYNKVEKPETGYRTLAKWLEGEIGARAQAVFLSTGYGAEGMLIAEMGQLQAVPRMFLVRSSKLLSDSDWNGSNYRLRLQSVRELGELLDSIPVRMVVLDQYTEGRTLRHIDLIEDLIQQHPEQWVLRKEFPVVDNLNRKHGWSRVYERLGSELKEVKNLRVDLSRMLDRWVTPR